MDPFEARFTKIATRRELTAGEPRVFRASGQIVLLRLDETGRVEAVDGSFFHNDLSVPSATRLEQILERIAEGSGAPSSEWRDIADRAGLTVELVDDEVWVCLEQCRGEADATTVRPGE